MNDHKNLILVNFIIGAGQTGALRRPVPHRFGLARIRASGSSHVRFAQAA